MTSPPAPTPPQQPPLLAFGFADMGPPETATYGRRFVAKVREHELLQGTWTKWSSTPDELTVLIVELENAILAAEGHGNAEIEDCKLKTAFLKKKLAYAHMHTEMVADSNPAVIVPLGLKMRQLPGVKKGLPVTIDKAPHLSATQGESTVLVCKSTRPAGAAAILVQITEDPSSEANWADYDTFLNLSFRIAGRVPGRTYYLRAKGKGRNGESGPYSNIVCIISL